LLVVAGEASGDMHGARLLRSLRDRLPNLESFGMGGPRLRGEGLDTLVDSREIAVVGLWEALSVIKRARRALRELLAEVDRRKPLAAVLIDSPDFNLRLARHLKRRGIRVIYYVSPQVWAWREGRVRTIEKRVDAMLVLFAFEEEFYRKHGMTVVHVGHPLVDEVPQLDHVLSQGAGEDPLRVALLPGSRESEVRALLPVMHAALAELSESRRVQAVLVEAPSVDSSLVDGILGQPRYPLERMRQPERRFETLAGCHLAVCASGTASLEVGLVGTPMVVVYRVAALTALLARLLIRVEHISLVNLVLGREVVPELLQARANAPGIAACLAELAGDGSRLLAMHRQLAELRPRLGEPGASERAAAEVARVLERAA
jgi:lipid-A-disaccharide synthase